jgi:hypothetical protein
MKSIKRLTGWLLFTGLSITCWSCLEYHVTTQVLPDGRILRTVTVKGDSTDIFRGSFRVPADSSWEITTRYESRNENDVTEGKVYVYEARKEFKDFKALNLEFYNDSVYSEHIAIRVDLKKQFRWYYTHYVYTETYGMLFPFRSVPIGNYLREEELRIHQAGEDDIYYDRELDKIVFAEDTAAIPPQSGDDSLRFKALRDSIGQKFESWQKINIYNDFYEVVSGALDRMKHPKDTGLTRESFYQWLDREKAFEKGIEQDDAFLQAASAYYRVDPATLRGGDPEGFAAFNKKFRIAAYSLESYTNQVLMPGMIVRTNARKIDVNTATWIFKIDTFYAADYTMSVESRVVNKWFVLIAGLILIAAIGGVLIRLFKK